FMGAPAGPAERGAGRTGLGQENPAEAGTDARSSTSRGSPPTGALQEQQPSPRLAVPRLLRQESFPRLVPRQPAPLDLLLGLEVLPHVRQPLGEEEVGPLGRHALVRDERAERRPSGRLEPRLLAQ